MQTKISVHTFCSMFINTFDELTFQINKINAERTYDHPNIS